MTAEAAQGGSGAPPAGAGGVTLAVTRGTARLLEDLGHAVVTELRLASGRRADIVALAPDGTLTIVEVKSGLPDFAADQKWPVYTAFCDRFFFAVGPEFPVDRLPGPAISGLILADAWDAEVLRDAPTMRLPPARRKAMTIRFAVAAAKRLRALQDPRI